MSKNVVDAIIEFSNKNGINVGLIPSRRQIDKEGGYSNNWTTKSFSEYVRSRSDLVYLQRDHSGPGQGERDDDGYESLEEDCKYFDSIHVDPWKRYNLYHEGLSETIKIINFCNEKNSQIKFEIGTEESIRRFDPDEVERLIIDLKNLLSAESFSRIERVVIQSGTALRENENTGLYNQDRLREMISVVRKHGLLTKEHNGDYQTSQSIFEKFSLGLDSMNFAPEMGLIETEFYLENMDDIEDFWRICYSSNRWKKWVDNSFDPVLRKKDLIKICGHYVFSNDDFQSLIKSYDANFSAKEMITKKLEDLYGLR